MLLLTTLAQAGTATLVLPPSEDAAAWASAAALAGLDVGAAGDGPSIVLESGATSWTLVAHVGTRESAMTLKPPTTQPLREDTAWLAASMVRSLAIGPDAAAPSATPSAQHRRIRDTATSSTPPQKPTPAVFATDVTPGNPPRPGEFAPEARDPDASAHGGGSSPAVAATSDPGPALRLTDLAAAAPDPDASNAVPGDRAAAVHGGASTPAVAAAPDPVPARPPAEPAPPDPGTPPPPASPTPPAVAASDPPGVTPLAPAGAFAASPSPHRALRPWVAAGLGISWRDGAAFAGSVDVDGGLESGEFSGGPGLTLSTPRALTDTGGTSRLSAWEVRIGGDWHGERSIAPLAGAAIALDVRNYLDDAAVVSRYFAPAVMVEGGAAFALPRSASFVAALRVHDDIVSTFLRRGSGPYLLLSPWQIDLVAEIRLRP
jgi:hypothetical protein